MIISYVSVSQALDKDYFQMLKQQLPQNLAEKNDRYRQYLDRQRNLFGLMLLKKLWTQQFNEPLALDQLQSTPYRRPFVPNHKADFNISHAGNYVVCVLHPSARIGIDIEMRKKVDFGDFTQTMNADQWDEINSSGDPEAKFFKYWCIKESVIKADGRGLSIPLTDIMINSDSVSYADLIWHIKPFHIDAEHFGCLACDQNIPDFTVNEVFWGEL